MSEAASPKAIKRATRDFGVLSKAANTALPRSGATFVGVTLTDSAGHANATEADTNVFNWLVTVTPAPDNLYAGKSYDILLALSPTDFPFAAPVAVIKTPIFSPIVSPGDGKLCEGILKNDDWQPTTAPLDVIDTVCVAIFSRFGELETLNEEAAALYHKDRAAFEAKVRAMK